MAYHFPSAEWLDALHETLNSDAQYAEIAKNWEGDLLLIVEPDEAFAEKLILYLDLWHGTSRQVMYDASFESQAAAFTISAPFSNWLRILQGHLNPIQAMATGKLRIKGNMAYIMRNVPTVLDFTRCAQSVPFEA